MSCCSDYKCIIVIVTFILYYYSDHINSAVCVISAFRFISGPSNTKTFSKTSNRYITIHIPFMRN
jgi:hypothetical protein